MLALRPTLESRGTMRIWIAAIGILLGTIAMSSHAPLATTSQAHAEPITEDSPSWSCVDDGNRVCGPGNPEGKPAACYDDGGVIVALWPCEPWVPDQP